MKINQKQETGNQKQKLFSLKFNVSSFQFASGQMMIIAIIFLAVILVISAALFARVAGFLRFGSNSILREQATNLAEAGIDYAIFKLNETAGSYTGTGVTEVTVGTIGSFTTTVQEKNPPNPQLKTITSTGYIPNKTNPRAKRTLKVDVLISAESIGSSKIDGDAYTVGTITTPDPTVTGTKYQNQPASEMPTVDYQYWKNQAEAGGTTNCPAGLCKYDGGVHNLGPRKLVGKLELANSAYVTMDGPIYVTGDVEVHNSAVLKLNDNFGSNGSVLIADGTITVRNDGELQSTNATPKGYILAVTTSTDPNQAISIRNRGVNAIFYALDGTAEMRNNAKVTALVAKQLIIRNSASLDYDSGLASAQFSSGPGGSWQIKRGTYRFTISP
ncbi:MAG: hypothetical protein UW37_C0036G0004 [Candidatus Gottesmanbacteria bacterium GW2011_GWA2_44_17]|uniref:Type 4 fimbrial biogenesis protein PilX N-terminal domain-containing protein n=1 Tax=Candidatus Gottesmanbacteria bacterium GW2011_GWA2_44_17 TaxID=1618444 RepID=A0A0G1KDP7_9BACT|nr:MAG: hypothetical protein UW37_C0036G0004 [Candidatus Gottesmanbacteria bacterium GW2011_GWA2_44_17]